MNPNSHWQENILINCGIFTMKYLIGVKIDIATAIILMKSQYTFEWKASLILDRTWYCFNKAKSFFTKS